MSDRKQYNTIRLTIDGEELTKKIPNPAGYKRYLKNFDITKKGFGDVESMDEIIEQLAMFFGIESERIYNQPENLEEVAQAWKDYTPNLTIAFGNVYGFVESEEQRELTESEQEIQKN